MQFGDQFGTAHHSFSHQHAVEPGGARERGVLGAVDARLEQQRGRPVHRRAQPRRQRGIHLEGGQVAAVDAGQQRAHGARLGQVGIVVHLHQRCHAQLQRAPVQAAQLVRAQAGRQQQHRVGAGAVRHLQVTLVEQEVLAQHAQVRARLLHRDQVGERAAEVVRLGQHRHRAHPRGGVAARLPHRIEPRRNGPPRRRPPLDLAHQQRRRTRATARGSRPLRIARAWTSIACRFARPLHPLAGQRHRGPGLDATGTRAAGGISSGTGTPAGQRHQWYQRMPAASRHRLAQLRALGRDAPAPPGHDLVQIRHCTPSLRASFAAGKRENPSGSAPLNDDRSTFLPTTGSDAYCQGADTAILPLSIARSNMVRVPRSPIPPPPASHGGCAGSPPSGTSGTSGCRRLSGTASPSSAPSVATRLRRPSRLAGPTSRLVG